MREKYESLALAQLRELAKVRGIKGAATMKKHYYYMKNGMEK